MPPLSCPGLPGHKGPQLLALVSVFCSLTFPEAFRHSLFQVCPAIKARHSWLPILSPCNNGTPSTSTPLFVPFLPPLPSPGLPGHKGPPLLDTLFSLPSSPDHQHKLSLLPFKGRSTPSKVAEPFDRNLWSIRTLHNGIHTHIVLHPLDFTQPPSLSKSGHIPATSHYPQGQVCPAIKARHSCCPATSFHIRFSGSCALVSPSSLLSSPPFFPSRT